MGIAPRVSLLAILSFSLAGACPALINGEVDASGRYGAVVALWAQPERRCSATKIAPRTFLTAGHCVIDVPSGGLAPGFRTGGEVRLSNRPTASWAEAKRVAVAETLLTPAFAQALRRLHAYQQTHIADYRARYSGEALTQRIRVVQADSRISDRFPDAALVRVRETTPDIPVIPVDLAALKAGAEVVLVGYGCERVGDWLHPGPRARHPRRTWGRSQVIRVDAVNFYSFGSEGHPGSATLCPGDSGGPVLFRGRVVGVHGTVWGLSRLSTARSNMSVNLHALSGWEAWPASDGTVP